MSETLRILTDTLQESVCGTINPDAANERLQAEETAKAVLKWLASEISYGSEWQVEDPRLNYVDVQVDKDFYKSVHGTAGY